MVDVPLEFWLVVTQLGSGVAYMAILPLVFWCVDRRVGRSLFVVLCAATFVIGALKLLFKIPRPYWTQAGLPVSAAEQSFSFPSGHALSSGAVWGSLTWYLLKWWFVAVGVFLTAVVGISRVMIGVHSWLDVLFGWVFGIVLLNVVVDLDQRWGNRIGGFGFYKKLALIVCCSGGIVVFSVVVNPLLWGFEIPYLWNVYAVLNSGVGIDPLSPLFGVIAGGVLLGFGCGEVFCLQFVEWSVEVKFTKKCVRGFFGLFVLLLIFVFCNRVLPSSGNFLLWCAWFVVYMALGLWVSFGAPLCFVFFEKIFCKKCC